MCCLSLLKVDFGGKKARVFFLPSVLGQAGSLAWLHMGEKENTKEMKG